LRSIPCRLSQPTANGTIRMKGSARRATWPAAPGWVNQRTGGRSGTEASRPNEIASTKVAVCSAITESIGSEYSRSVPNR
jgi:hypothetical protein